MVLSVIVTFGTELSHIVLVFFLRFEISDALGQLFPQRLALKTRMWYNLGPVTCLFEHTDTRSAFCFFRHTETHKKQTHNYYTICTQKIKKNRTKTTNKQNNNNNTHNTKIPKQHSNNTKTQQ